ncbi:MAG: tetratricopeptide repeat protein [Pseudomonadota bacterium]
MQRYPFRLIKRIGPILLLVALLLPLAAMAQEEEDLDPLKLAAVLLGDGHLDRAERALKRFETEGAEEAERARYFFLRGRLARQRGEPEAALTAFGQALDAGYDQPDIHLYRARAAFDAGEPERTLEALEELGQEGEDVPATHALRVAAHWRLEQREEAWTALEAAIQHFPERVEFRRQRLEYLLELRLFSRALEVADNVIERSETPAKDAAAVGASLVKAGRTERAIPFLERYRMVHPAHADLAVTLARAYLESGRVHAAAGIMDGAAARHPELAEKAAEIHRRAGNLSRALHHNARVAEGSDKLRQRLGLFLERKAHDRAAAMDRDLRRNGLLEDESIRYALAYAHFRTGGFDRVDELLTGIADPDLFRKATELRRAMEECGEQAWQCQ